MTTAAEPSGGDASAGRRRGSSRHRSERGGTLPGGLAWVLYRGIALVSLVPVLVAVVLVQSLNPAAQQVPAGLARFDLAGAWLALPTGNLGGYTEWFDAPPFGWVQLGAVLRLLQAGGAQSVLAAAHGAMLLLTLVQVALLWLVLRRGGASGLAAGSAAAVFGLVPSAIGVHTAVSSMAVATIWLLAAAAVVSSRRVPQAGVLAGIAAGLAVITAPATALVVAAIAVHLLLPAPVRARASRAADPVPRRRLIGAALALAAVVIASRIVAGVLALQVPTAAGLQLEQVGRAASTAAWGLGTAAATTWLTGDPLTLLVVTAAIVLLAPVGAFRPLVALAILLALASFWPLGTDAVAPIMLLLTVTAVAVAAMVDRAVAALGDPAFRRSVIGSAWLTGVAAVLIVGAVAWLLSLAGLQRSADQPVARAAAWMRASVPRGQVVLVDLGLWPDLSRDAGLHVGWYAAGAVGAPSSVPWGTADYVLADSALSSAASGTAAGRTLERSLPVAGFGAGAAQLEVRAVQRATASPSPTATPSSAAELKAAAARRSTGAQLAENPRIILSGSDRAALLAGEVDSRISIVLAQFVTEHKIVVAAFPATADDQGVRRQVVISSVDGARVPTDATATGTLLRYLSSLRDDYSTQSIDATSQGLLATFAVDPTFTP